MSIQAESLKMAIYYFHSSCMPLVNVILHLLPRKPENHFLPLNLCLASCDLPVADAKLAGVTQRR